MIGVPLLLLAAVGWFVPGRPGRVARTGAVVTALGLLGAWLSPLLVTALDGTGRTVTAGTGVFASVALLGLLMSAQAAVGDLQDRGAIGRTAVAVLGGLAVVSVLATAVLWLAPRTVSPADLQTAARAAAEARTADGEPQAALEDWGLSPLVQPGHQRSVPATAADQGLSHLACLLYTSPSPRD